MATGVVKPADDRRSGAAPGSAGASAATPTPRDGLPRPNPTTTLRALCACTRVRGFAGRRGRVPEARDRGLGAAPPDRPHAPAASSVAKAERPSSAAAGTANRAVQPPHDTPSAAAPGSAVATWNAPEPRDHLPRPDPTSTLRVASRPPAPTGLRGPSGPRAGARVASHGAAPPNCPNASIARGAAKAERLSSAAAETACGAAKLAQESPSAAAPGSAGASGPHRGRATTCPRPTQLLRVVRLRGLSRRQDSRAVGAACRRRRDGERRGRAAEPPARVRGLWGRRGRTTQLTRRRGMQPPTETTGELKLPDHWRSGAAWFGVFDLHRSTHGLQETTQ